MSISADLLNPTINILSCINMIEPGEGGGRFYAEQSGVQMETARQ